MNTLAVFCRYSIRAIKPSAQIEPLTTLRAEWFKKLLHGLRTIHTQGFHYLSTFSKFKHLAIMIARRLDLLDSGRELVDAIQQGP